MGTASCRCVRPVFSTSANSSALRAKLPARSVAARDERAGAEEQGEPRRRRKDVVGRLAHVHVIVGMHARVGAARLAEELAGAVGEHFVRVHVVRGAGAGLIDVDDELVAQAAAQDFVGGRDDGARHAGVEPAERRVRLGGGFLDEDRGGDEIGGRAQAADGEVLDRARRLDAVVRLGGNLQLAQRIALGAEGFEPRHSILPGMLPSFFDSVLQLIIRTSTDLPPDVRAAMKTALDAEPGGHALVAGAHDHRAEHRPRGRQRRRDLPGHGHADLRDQGARRRQSNLDA